MSGHPQMLDVARGAPILDYAAPQSRGRIRLPARSDIILTRDAGFLRIHEVLAGRIGAFFALVFGLLTGAGIIATGIAPLMGLHPDRHIFDASLCFTVAVGEVLLMFAVIDNTWRTTTLTLTGDEIELRFRSPLRGKKLHRWNAEKLRSAHIRQAPLQIGGPEFAELQLDFWNDAPVRLFLGHRLSELQELLTHIHQLQPPAQTPPPNPPNPQDL
jgi:hypothetical protein